MSVRLVWLDGHVVPECGAGIRWDHAGLLEGYGLFETIRVAGGRAFLAGCHAQRITDAAPRLGLEPWLHPRTLTRGIDRLVRESGLVEGVVRVYLLPSGTFPPSAGPVAMDRAALDPERRDGLQPTLLSKPCHGKSGDNPKLHMTWCPQEHDVCYVGTVSALLPMIPVAVGAMLAPDLRDPRGPLVGLKTLSRAAETLLLARARAQGAGEALWRNLAGRITEGTRSNLFLIEGRRLVTPPVSEGLLAGITRWFVLSVAKDAGLTPSVELVTVERLLAADEAFLTSTLRGVVPLKSLDADLIGGGAPGPGSETLRRLLARYTVPS